MQTDQDSDTLTTVILKECFWDYNIEKEDIKKMAASSDFRQKQKLFEKILYNATDKVYSLGIFSNNDLPGLFNAHTSRYAEKRMQDHILALRNIFLGENNAIQRLQWKNR